MICFPLFFQADFIEKKNRQLATVLKAGGGFYFNRGERGW